MSYDIFKIIWQRGGSFWFVGEIAQQQQEHWRPVVLFHAQPLLLMGTLEDAVQKCMACIVVQAESVKVNGETKHSKKQLL